jgi:uncharacterized protein with HEPN domain
MDGKIKTWLYDMLKAIEEIENFLGNAPRRYADYCSNVLLRRGVERNIEIIGEATSRILKADPAFPIANARKIVDTRNYVIHGYDSLRDDIVWSIVINHLPQLKAEVEKLLKSSASI